MQDWNPEQYLRFRHERTRPAAELLARIAIDHPGDVTDLGCGPGNSTALLAARWPQARITGVDTSPQMLSQAREALPQCHFQQADITHWHADAPQNIIFANASLQWIGQHHRLFPHLLGQLAPAGVLAVQMPDNWQEPTHALMRQTAQTLGFVHSGREPLLAPEQYYDVLSESGCDVDIWRTAYYHVMPSTGAIIDWLSSTGLRPWLDPLTESERQAFLAHYDGLLQANYSIRADGSRLMRFPRLFILARKPALHA